MSRTSRHSRADLDIRSLAVDSGGLTYAGTALTPTAAELNALSGNTATAAEMSKLSGITGYPMQSAEITFTETSGAGVWTGTVSLPAGATIHDIIINGVALWTSQTSATMKVGDGVDDDGYYTGIDLKATDLLAGESLSLALAGGKQGAYVANSQVSPRYNAAASSVIGVITKVGTSGTAGRTRMLVIWSATGAQTAASKV